MLSQNGAIRSSMNDGLLTATEITELDLQGSRPYCQRETAIDFGNEKLLGIDGLASAFIFAALKEFCNAMEGRNKFRSETGIRHR